MNNVGKPVLYGLTQPTIGTFFPGNHLTIQDDKNKSILFLLKWSKKSPSQDLTSG
jgi:hypothetical protein